MSKRHHRQRKKDRSNKRHLQNLGVANLEKPLTTPEAGRTAETQDIEGPAHTVAQQAKKEFPYLPIGLFGRLHRPIKKIWRGVVLLFACLGFVGTVATLSYRLGITPSTPSSPGSPLSNYFTVRNDGIFPIYEVTCDLQLFRMRSIDSTVYLPYMRETVLFQSKEKVIHQINPTTAATFSYSLGPNKPIMDTDFGVLVSFDFLLIPWRIQQRYRFAAHLTDEGKLEWVEKSYTEPYP